MTEIFLVPGVRTPFVKGGGPFAPFDALAISAPVAKAMRPCVSVASGAAGMASRAAVMIARLRPQRSESAPKTIPPVIAPRASTIPIALTECGLK